MSRAYHHSQAGLVIVFAFAITATAVIVLVRQGVLDARALALAGALAICIRAFGSLTVDVNADAVSVRFGFGLVRRRFPVGAIETVRPVRIPWYQWWGISRLARGRVYSVAGADAVELELATGEVHRIGTDEPLVLAAAIEQARGLPAN